jgi:hypothetical protein
MSTARTYYHAVPGTLGLRPPETDTTAAAAGDAPAEPIGWGAYLFTTEEAALEWARRHEPDARTVELHRFRLKPDATPCDPFNTPGHLDSILEAADARGLKSLAFAQRFAQGLDERESSRLWRGLSRLGFDVLLGRHSGVALTPEALEPQGSELRRIK